jgi:hypothetical protein
MFLGGLPSFGGSFVFLNGVLPFYSLYSPTPYFGCFDLFMIGKVSSSFFGLNMSLRGLTQKVPQGTNMGAGSPWPSQAKQAPTLVTSPS